MKKKKKKKKRRETYLLQGAGFFILKEDRVDRVNSESWLNHPSLADLVPSL